LRQLPKPTGALLFVSGVPSPALAIAQIVAHVAKGVSALVIPASGVLTESNEMEGVAAVAGVVWSVGKARCAAAASPDELSRILGDGGTTCAFFAADGFEDDEVTAMARTQRLLFGAGAPGPVVYAVREGQVDAGRIAAMRFDGVSVPIVEVSPACKLVTEQFVVTEMERSLVTRLDGEPALDVLSDKAGGGRHGGLILVAVHDHGHDDRFLVRPLRGIDPAKKAIAVAGDLKVGDVISFAVRDPMAAREDLIETARRAERQALGSAPTFAIYLSCSGRGRALYGEPDVDVRILKRRFPNVPIAGMHSAFEVVPWGAGAARMQLMSGVVALFRSPS
jgi:hypothetical protein